MEKNIGCYFQVQSHYYQVAQCNQKTPILVSSRCINQKTPILVSSVLRNLPKLVLTDLIIKYDLVLTNQFLGVKIYTNLVGNIMLIISPLCWIKSILSSSKEGNLLVLLKYQGLLIEQVEQVFLNPAYLVALLFGLRTLALFNGLWISVTVPIQAMALKLHVCSYCLASKILF